MNCRVGFQGPLPKIQLLEVSQGFSQLAHYFAIILEGLYSIDENKQTRERKYTLFQICLSIIIQTEELGRKRNRHMLTHIFFRIARRLAQLLWGEEQKEDRPGHYIWDTAALSKGIQQRNPTAGSQLASPHTCTALCRDTSSCTKSTLSTASQGCICAKKKNLFCTTPL